MLIAIEGLDKTLQNTQIELLRTWLLREGITSYHPPWKPSKVVRSAIKEGQRAGAVSPLTLTLLTAADFADRLAQTLLPPLQAGYIVFADQYLSGMVLRAAARGLCPAYAAKLHAFAPRPDVAFYLRVPMAHAGNASPQSGPGARAAMPAPPETPAGFEERLSAAFGKHARSHGLRVIDGLQTVERQQRRMRLDISALLARGKGLRGVTRKVKE